MNTINLPMGMSPQINCPIYIKILSCIKMSRLIKHNNRIDLVKEFAEAIREIKLDIIHTSYPILSKRKDLQYFLKQLTKCINDDEMATMIDVRVSLYVINAAMDGYLNEKYRRAFGNREAHKTM